jgi:hypothetical protein
MKTESWRRGTGLKVPVQGNAFSPARPLSWLAILAILVVLGEKPALPGEVLTNACHNKFAQLGSPPEGEPSSSSDSIYESLQKNRKNLKTADRALAIANISKIGEHLPELQRKELSDYFSSILGIPCSPENVMQVRDKISGENLKRIMESLPPTPTNPEFTKLKSMVANSLKEQFETHTFIHNTVDSANAQPLWFSSKELMDMGFDGGLQSRSPFNRDYLKTSNFVFFWASEPNRDYGQDAKLLKFQYGQDAGFVSPYVMDVPNLVSVELHAKPEMLNQLKIQVEALLPRSFANARSSVASEGLDPNSVEGMRKILTNAITDSHDDYINTVDLLDKLKPFFDSAKRDQAKFIFTTENYLNLCTEAVSRQLWAKSGASAVANIQPHSSLNIKDAMNFIGLPDSYELKVPVAIENKNFYHP